MKKILIATHNPGKLQEIKFALEPLIKKGINILSLADLNISQEPEETGKTFEENVMLKAKYYAGLTGLLVVCDDGGIAIEALSGEPGVRSRMWLGRKASDEELIKHTLKKLKGLPQRKRKAYFETCVLFFDPKNKRSFLEKERVYGYIATNPHKKRIRGFPFRALFVVSGLNKYYDELTYEEHKKINHRLKATRRLSKKITSYLLNPA